MTFTYTFAYAHIYKNNLINMKQTRQANGHTPVLIRKHMQTAHSILGKSHLEDSVLEAFQTHKLRVAKVSQVL